MSSDGKDRRKHHAPLCPKCNDQGITSKYIRSKGKIAGYQTVFCLKNCQAAQRKKNEAKVSDL